jgi:hypothetical protein
VHADRLGAILQPKATRPVPRVQDERGVARDRLHALLDDIGRRGGPPIREELETLFTLSRVAFEEKTAARRVIEAFARALELTWGRA